MSKNISITEGGTGRGFTARRLETALEGGGSCLWVPKDEVKRVTKSVNENGTYEAAAEKAYGYSQVHVYVKGGGSATGKGRDGKEYTVTVDENGDLVETRTPTCIRITNPPTFVGPYNDGISISYAGIQVTAYDSEGNEVRQIPTSELVFPETHAIYDASRKDYYEGGALKAIRVHNENRIVGKDNKVFWVSSSVGTVAYDDSERWGEGRLNLYIAAYNEGTTFWVTQCKGKLYFATLEQLSTFVLCGHWKAAGSQKDKIENRHSWGGIINEWLEAYNLSEIALFNIIPESTGSRGPSGSYWELIPNGSVNPITVQWARPGDGAILSDNFSITVREPVENQDNL